MPKSRHRKNHKNKVQAFKQGQEHSKTREIKEYYKKMQDKQEELKKSQEEKPEQPKPITL
mgnify:CR=1 FL=1|tara:strand:+ start:2804 stop:2983 length:180 start_codon:yes stop_codon:yes gene_type:complete